MMTPAIARSSRAFPISKPGRFTALLASLMGGYVFLQLFPAEAADPELEALRRSLETRSAEARALERDVTAMFVATADLPTDWLISHRQAMIGLGRIARTAGQVAKDSSSLAAFIASDEPKAPVTPETLDTAWAAYREATDNVVNSTSDVQDRIRALASEPDISGAAVSWPVLMTATDRYLADIDRFLVTIERIDQLVSLTTRQRRDQGAIKLHLYKFIDSGKGTNAPYGLYTHVLFLDDNSRNQAFLKALRDRTPKAGDVPADEAASINLFAIPVRNRVKARMAFEVSPNPGGVAGADIYDYEVTETLIRKICLNDDVRIPDLCDGKTGGGPFLIAHQTWLPGADRISPPLLMVDLSTVHEQAFGEFIKAVKAQVMLPDFSSGERIATLRLQLLTIILDTAYWLDPIKKSIADIVSLGGKK